MHWTQHPADALELKAEDFGKDGKKLTLLVSETLCENLAHQLKLTFEQAGELRLDLPSNWTVFWKVREVESRLLLAHPEHETWVATVALERSHAQALVERLEALEPGQPLVIGRQFPVARMSNAEVVLERR